MVIRDATQWLNKCSIKWFITVLWWRMLPCLPMVSGWGALWPVWTAKRSATQFVTPFLSFVSLRIAPVSIPSFYLPFFLSISLLYIKLHFQHLPVLLQDWCTHLYMEFQLVDGASGGGGWLRQDCTICCLIIIGVLFELVISAVHSSGFQCIFCWFG